MRRIRKISRKNSMRMTRGKAQVNPVTNLAYCLIRQENKVGMMVSANFTDAFGLKKEVEITRYQFNNFNSCYKIFIDAGFVWPKDLQQCKQLHQSWCDSPAHGRIIRVLEPGWWQGHYRWPNMVQIINGRRYLYSVGNDGSRRVVEGTKDQWKQLTECAGYSPAMVFGLSLVFGSGLLRATNLRNPGLYWWAARASERAAFIETVTAISGGRSNIRLWNKSPLEINSAACTCNDFILCSEYPMDEPKFVKRLSTVVSELNSSQHRLVYMLVGERAVRRGIKGLNSFPLSCDPEFGMCDSLPPLGCPSSSELLRRIIELARDRNYAWVFRAFTDWVSADPKRISREVSDEMMLFMRKLNISDPDEQELAGVFALAFAGGVIAARMKLLPWNRRRIGSVIARYYRMARGEMARASIPEQPDEADIEQLRSKLRGPTVLFLARHANKPSWTAEEAQKAEAFYRKEPEPAGWLVPGETLSRWFGVEKARRLISWLKTNGYLITKESRSDVNTYQCQIMGIPGASRYYLIADSFSNPEPNPTSIKNDGPQADDSSVGLITI